MLALPEYRGTRRALGLLHSPSRIMRRFLARSAYWFWLGLSAVIVLTAITVSLFRMLLPLASDYRGLIQEEVSAVVGRSVQIEVVKAEWKGFIPRIALQDVKILDAQNRELILSVGEAYVSVDLLGSLTQGELVLDHLGIVGIDLTVRRQLDGAVVLQGMEGSDGVIGAWVIDA